MIQAEIGAARCNEEGTFPTKGLRFRDFEFFTTNGQSIQISDFRGRSNLVLLFLGKATPDTLEFAQELADRSAEFEQRESRLLIAFIATGKHLTSVRTSATTMLVPDSDATAHQHFGAIDDEGNPEQACYIADRFGEVFAAFRTRDGNLIPGTDAILDWLDFIEAQCPECESPEWPMDAT